MSKPATQNVIAAPHKIEGKVILPLTASQPPIDAEPRTKPRTKCEKTVNLLVYEYIIIMNIATGSR